MASHGASGTTPSTFPSNFYLTRQQQDLLMAALTSAAPPDGPTARMNPAANPADPNQPQAADPFGLGFGAGDGAFGVDFTTVGDDALAALDGSDGWTNPDNMDSMDNLDNHSSNEVSPVASTETHEKRSHPDDDDEDDDDGGSGGGRSKAKRRESGDKVPKKPGRKLLTDEPVSKRKAQNRAAQRAFRERKEQHLKNLETQVEELTKASRESDQANVALREEIKRMKAELDQYKQRLAALGSAKHPHRDSAASLGNLGDVNFQFEFPRFGVLPGPAPATTAFTKSLSPASQHSPQPPALDGSAVVAPGAGGAGGALPNGNQPPFKAGTGSSGASSGSMSSQFGGQFGAAATSSPSAVSSHNSNNGMSSSGASPESLTQSPMDFLPLDSWTPTGGAEQPAASSIPATDTSGAAVPDFDWLARLNGGQFDPQIFGGYRDPQDGGLGTLLDDNLFGDTDVDFFTPFFLPSAPLNLEPPPTKDAAAAAVLPIQQTQHMAANLATEPAARLEGYSMDQIWNKLQTCDRVRNGEIDIDELCAELKQKATCNGKTVQVDKQSFHTVMEKYAPSGAGN